MEVTVTKNRWESQFLDLTVISSKKQMLGSNSVMLPKYNNALLKIVAM